MKILNSIVMIAMTGTLGTNAHALGYYVQSGDGSVEWRDTIVVAKGCLTKRGAASTFDDKGVCREISPDTQYEDPMQAAVRQYLDDLGRAAKIAAINSKNPDAVSGSVTNSPIMVDNNSGSNSAANSNSNSGATANAEATARNRAIQQQLQEQEQTYIRNRF